jgi:hypothetical protein
MRGRAVAQYSNSWKSDFSGDWLSDWKAIKKPPQHPGQPPEYGVDFGKNNLQVLPDGQHNSSCFLRVTYPKGSYSPSAPAPKGGTQFYGPLLPGVNEACLTYSIRFPGPDSEPFNWVKGGKLPGLYGGTGNTGTHHPKGTDGFTTRCMWRENGTGIGYPFVFNTPRHQDGSTWPIANPPLFKADGQWHTMMQIVTVNAHSNSNQGTIAYYYDDLSTPMTVQNGIWFSTTPALQINGIIFQTFFGGGKPCWKTPTTQFADFTNFILQW